MYLRPINAAWIVVIAFLLLAAPAGAAPVLYNTRAEWLAAVTSVVANIDFTAQATGVSGYTYYNTASGLTVAEVNFLGYTGTPGTYNLTVVDPSKQSSYNRGTGPVLVGGYGPAYLLVTLPGSGAYAVGVDFSTVTLNRNVLITLSSGESYNITSASTSTMKFFGFTSDVPVTSIQFSGSGTNVILDNFSYAQEASEPGSLALGLAGTLGIWLARRLRRKVR